MLNRKITPGQLALIFLLARIMHTMLYRFDSFASGTPLMAGQLLSTAAEAVLCVPAAVFFTKFPGAKIFEGGLPARAVSVFEAAYFTVIAGGTVALFAEFLQNKFSGTVFPAAAIVILCAAAAYCAGGGLEGIARAAAVVFWLFAALFAVTAVLSEGKPDTLNLLPFDGESAKAAAEYFVESLSSAWWIPMLAALSESLRSGAAKAAAGFLILKLAIIETLLLLITLILWRYVGVLGYPILALGAYAKSDFVQRFDAINMLVWTVNCAIVCGAYVFIAARPFKKPKAGAIAMSAAAAVFGLWQYRRGLRFNEPWLIAFKLFGIFVLGTLLPLLGLIIRHSKNKKEAYAE